MARTPLNSSVHYLTATWLYVQLSSASGTPERGMLYTIAGLLPLPLLRAAWQHVRPDEQSQRAKPASSHDPADGETASYPQA
jgi:hypothetical protein